jgi:bisphosphoglycerate-independent phosphoglycerate mutase (AlkP superfamily)
LYIETEKYAHVTFFFNGGVEKQYEGEERHMIDSPKVATYDKQPKMSVQGVADKVAQVIRADQHEFVMCNFAPPDMVRPLFGSSFLSRTVFNSPYFYFNSRRMVFGWCAS